MLRVGTVLWVKVTAGSGEVPFAFTAFMNVETKDTLAAVIRRVGQAGDICNYHGSFPHRIKVNSTS